jgi:hypothetical protein
MLKRGEGVVKAKAKAFYFVGVRKLADCWIKYVEEQCDYVEKRDMSR